MIDRAMQNLLDARATQLTDEELANEIQSIEANMELRLSVLASLQERLIVFKSHQLERTRAAVVKQAEAQLPAWTEIGYRLERGGDLS